jgi:hypothetical protein
VLLYRLPIAVSVLPPAESAPLEPARSDRPTPPVLLGDRVALYGLSLELPVGWRDQTALVFESESGPFEKIAITDDPELAGHVEEWLSSMREKIRGLNGAQPGAIRRYEHSELEISGFSVTFPKSVEKVHVVVTAESEQALNWYVICRSSCEAALEDLLRSLRRANPGSQPPLDPVARAGGKYGQRAYDWEFETSDRLSNPAGFLMESEGEGRMSCERAAEPPEFEDPDWSARFNLAYEAVLSPVVEVRRTSVGRANPPFEAPVFATRHDLLTAHESGASRALTYAQATTPVGNVFFSCTFAREGAHRESRARVKAML